MLRANPIQSALGRIDTYCRSDSGQEVLDAGFQFRVVIGPIAVDFPRFTGEGDTIGGSPSMNRVVRLMQSHVRTDMESGGNFAGGSFGGVNLAGAVELTNDLDAEVDIHWRLSVRWMVIEKDVVTILTKAWVVAQELPNLI